MYPSFCKENLILTIKTIKIDLHKITIIFRNSFSYREVNKVYNINQYISPVHPLLYNMLYYSVISVGYSYESTAFFLYINYNSDVGIYSN